MLIMALSKLDREEIKGIIKLTVNGKIDRIDEKLDAHIETHSKIANELEIVVDAVKWISTTRKFVLWVGGFFGSVGTIVALFKFLD
jgi:hypothetical protein